MVRLSKVEHAVQKALGTLNNYKSDVTLYVKVTIDVPLNVQFSVDDMPSEEAAAKAIEEHLDGDTGPKDLTSLLRKTVKQGDKDCILSKDDVSHSLDMDTIYKEVAKKIKAGKYTYTITSTEKV